jgi:predicted transcriptional regulator
MMRTKKIGEAELELLRYVSSQGAVTVRQATEHFAPTHGYVRTTLQQMMERLTKKGFLKREPIGGAYHYSAAEPEATLDRSLVSRFVENTLSGSVSPFVSYLAESENLSDDDLDRLRQLVTELEAKRKENKR